MTKIFFLCAALMSTITARENPFFAAAESSALPVTSNMLESRPKLTSLPYNLSTQARVLKEISFTVQNVDGSIETRTVAVDKDIDWHAPLIISQSSRSHSTESGISDGKSSSADFGFIHIDTHGKRLVIKTNDTLVRHFALTDPNRIVIDYKHQEPFTLKNKALNAPPYTSVSIANHGKFVRVTLTLDGKYDYSLKNSAGFVSITCL